MSDIYDAIEEKIMDLLARIDDGDAAALNELKNMKKYIEEMADFLAVIDDRDTIDTIKNKFDKLSEKFDEFLMSVVKVVG